jgi:AcrR family transcriptional regulator
LSEAERGTMLDAVIAAVASGGYDAITLRSVAAETGMSPARLSYHFGTKQKLFLAALEHVEQRAHREADASMRNARTHWQRLGRLISAVIPGGVGDPEWQIWLAAFYQAPYDPDVSAVLAASSRVYRERLESVIRDGVEAGEFTAASPGETAAIAAAALDGLAIECVAGVPGVTPARVRRLVLGLLRRELGVHPDKAS